MLRTNHPNFNVADPANPLTHGRTSSDPFIYKLGTRYNVHMPLFRHVDENGQVKWLDLNLDSPSNLKIVLNPNYTRSYEAAPFDAIIPQ
jgi:hypothetical protein